MLIATSAQSWSLVPENSGNRNQSIVNQRRKKLSWGKLSSVHSSSTHFEAINWDVLFWERPPQLFEFLFPANFPNVWEVVI